MKEDLKVKLESVLSLSTLNAQIERYNDQAGAIGISTKTPVDPDAALDSLWAFFDQRTNERELDEYAETLQRMQSVIAEGLDLYFNLLTNFSTDTVLQ